jgi:hypothetical protein
MTSRNRPESAVPAPAGGHCARRPARRVHGGTQLPERRSNEQPLPAQQRARWCRPKLSGCRPNLMDGITVPSPHGRTRQGPTYAADARYVLAVST